MMFPIINRASNLYFLNDPNTNKEVGEKIFSQRLQ